MNHEQVDLLKWKELFPLDALRDEARRFVSDLRTKSPDRYKTEKAFEEHVLLMSPGGELITSPFHLAVVEQLRIEALSGENLPTVPCDIFVFGKGEPTNRAVTKIGGLPFRPAQSSWPVGKSGKPMVFIGQFCFIDSRDIDSHLPGDILLIFADGIYGEDWWDDETDALHFEWVNISEFELIGPSSAPTGRWDILPCYGVKHRTVDYVDVQERLEDHYKQSGCIPIFEGTKIGGIPRFIQGAENIGGRFLCALGSVQPEPKRLYPYVNVPEPFDYWSPDGRKESERLLTWGDAGSLYLFLENNGTVRWVIQGY